MAGLLGKIGLASELAGGTRALFLACVVAGSVQLLAALLPLSVQPLRISVPSSVAVTSSVTGEADAVPETGSAMPTSFDFAEIQARPIFLADRRPITIASVPKTAAVQEEIKPDAGIFASQELVGIIEEGPATSILLSSRADGKTVLFAPGDALGLWRFERLEGETAIFVAGAEEYRLVLKEREEGTGGDAFVRKQTGSTKSRRRGRP